MKRLLVVLLSSIALVGSAAPAATAHPDSESWINCHFHWRQGVEQVKAQINCLADLIDSPGGGAKATSVVSCETGGTFAPGLVSESGTFIGLTQQHKSYWAARADTYLNTGKGIVPKDPSAKNARWNLIVGMKMAKADGTWANHWPTCGD